jgi:biopolymer transport protein TolR
MDVGGDKGNIRSEINVTPLVDVCLVLLIIFMVVTPMLGTAGVELPQTADPSRKPEDSKQVTIFVAAGNPPQLYLGDQLVTKEQFEHQLDETYQRTPTKPVVIKADRRLTWGNVKDVMRITKDAGFENVGLIAEKKQK